MDFFQAQQNARTSTFRLLVLFGLAILSLILVADIFVYISLQVVQSETGNVDLLHTSTFNSTVFIIVSCAVATVILIGSTYKTMVLSSGGGRVIAESMGGRLLLPETQDFEERRLLNVVEEMAIASGMPVPQVYVLDDEPVINAFAAGLTTSDAIIGVTRGTLEKLTRDELQGVIAHEYSHILNGDMSLNIYLIGLLHGILVLGIIGYYILRSSGRSRGKNSGGLLLFAVGLIVVGYGGTFFGNIIKASISRQREYLADASAVQFTRNPGGIGGALKKIGGTKDRSRLKNERAPELSHAYFSQGVSNWLGSLTATHPPLAERIRRVEPLWDGKYLVHEPVPAKTTETVAPTDESRRKKVAAAVGSTIVLQSVMNTVAHMGKPGEQEIETARSIIAEIPEEIHNAVHSPHGARAVMYCLVINREDETRKRQLARLEAHGDRGVYDLCLKYLAITDGIPTRCRLALVDMALPALRELSLGQYRKFRVNLGELVAADAKLDLFEWCLQKILYMHLDLALGEAKALNGRIASYDSLVSECRLLFSMLAYAGHKHPDEAATAFNAAAAIIGLKSLNILAKADISLNKFDQCLDKLALLKPLLKRDLLKACLASAMTDERMTTREMEVIRAVAAVLNCPLPPLDATPGET